MTEWIQKANDLIVLALGKDHSSVERIIIAFSGIIAFFLIIKFFTKEEGGVNATGFRRLLATVLILASVLFGAVTADIWVVPYVTNDILEKVTFVIIPAFVLVVISAPLLMLVLKKDYGGALVTVASAIIAGVVVVFAVSFIVDSFTGSDREFKNLKRRTHDIDEFINN